MTPPSVLFALAALLPAMTAPAEGTPQPPAVVALVVALCTGGSTILPLRSDNAPPPAMAPCCCAKGCRTGGKRQPIDRKR